MNEKEKHGEKLKRWQETELDGSLLLQPYVPHRDYRKEEEDCHLRHHLHRIGVYKGCRTCTWCELVNETAEHILLECEALGRHRLTALGPPGKEQENITANPVETILNFIRLVNLP